MLKLVRHGLRNMLGEMRGMASWFLLRAYRLRPFAITVQLQTDPVHWFLDDKDDIRSSYFYGRRSN
jgi:hypothetical protein